MLIKLSLKNIALIEIIEINFEKGLNIITGDSGSGKSLILDSLNVLFGGTNIPLKHLIRPGKQDCLIEAKFFTNPQVNDLLIQNGFQISSEISVKRESYKKNNKIISKYSINNLLAKKRLLEKLGLLLIDFAGQSDSLLFASQENRRSIIDDLGSNELKTINTKIKTMWEEFNVLQKRREEKIKLFNEKEDNNFAIKEMYKILEEANLNSSDEIIQLKAKECCLSNNFDINQFIQLSLNNLNNSSNDSQTVSELITQSIKQLNKIDEFDSKIKQFKDNLISIQDEVENLIFSLTEYLGQIDNDDITLEEIQNRLFYLQNLERTFSLELPELILKRDELKTHIDNNSYKTEINKLDSQISLLQLNLDTLFEAQSSQRRKTANQFQDSVISILHSLGLENAKFLIDFKKVKPTGEGSDSIDFLFSANPDQKLAALTNVISGGEMSRFLLAIKSSISKKTNSFFLDEIDNGLSGKSLFSLVELIKATAIERQVLCITHQPFLAATGKTHFKVKKNVIDGTTFTSVSKLTSKEERQNELIELIGGGFNEANYYASTLIDRAAA